MLRTAASRHRARAAFCLLLSATALAACGPRRAPTAPPAVLEAYRGFETRLRQAVAANEPGRVSYALESWTASQAPVAQEGDLYAQLLAEHRAPRPTGAVALVATTFAARFPNHPAAWRSHEVALRAALVRDDLEAAAAAWERLGDAPGEARLDGARRIAEALWQARQVEASLDWALRAPPEDPAAAGPYWQLLFLRAWQCCDDATALADTPIGRLIELKAALGAGDRAALADRSAWLARFAQRQGLDAAWSDLFAWLGALGKGPQAADDGALALLPLSGRNEGLGRHILAVLAACAGPDEQLTVADTRGRGPVAAAHAAGHRAQRRVFGPLRTTELQTTTPRLLAQGQVAATPNPNPLAPVVVTAPVWSVGLTPEDQARAVADVALGQGWRALAVLAPFSEYGERFLTALWTDVIAGGGWFTGVEQFDPTATDFGDPIRSLVGLDRYTAAEREALEAADEEPSPIIDFDALIVVGNSAQLSLLPAQLVYYDVAEVRVLGDAGWRAPEIGQIAKDYVAGTLFVDLAPGAAPTPTATDYQRCVTAVTPAPSALDAATYEGWRLLEALAGAPHAYGGWAPVPGVAGPLAPLPDHSVGRDLSVWRWTRQGPVLWDGRDPLADLRKASPDAPPEP